MVHITDVKKITLTDEVADDYIELYNEGRFATSVKERVGSRNPHSSENALFLLKQSGHNSYMAWFSLPVHHLAYELP